MEFISTKTGKIFNVRDVQKVVVKACKDEDVDVMCLYNEQTYNFETIFQKTDNDKPSEIKRKRKVLEKVLKQLYEHSGPFERF